MAEHKVTLGGFEKPLKYTRKDRAEFEARFGAGMWEVIRKQVLALNENDEPTPGGTVDAQYALVYFGLRHNGPKWSEAKVAEYLDAMTERGENVFAIFTKCATAVLASGVLGYKYEAPVETEDESDADPKADADAKTE